jgi:osmotically-inducible protein OsmY
VRDGVVVGIVSRGDLLEALLTVEAEGAPCSVSDGELRETVNDVLSKQSWTSPWPTNVVVNDGVVHLWGFVSGEAIRQAYRVAAENVPGVKRVKNHLRPVPAGVNMGV